MLQDLAKPPGASERTALPDRAGRPRWRLPIVWLLVLALPTLTCVAVASVLTLGIIDSRAYTRILIRDRADTVLDSIVLELSIHLDPVTAQLAAVAQEFASGAIDVGDDDAIYRYLSGVLTAVPQASGIGLARPDRQSSIFYRAGDHVARERQRASPRVRDWVEQAHVWTISRWIEPVFTMRTGRSVVMLLQPLHGPRSYIGVLLVPVPIDGLSRYLATLSLGLDQTPFVLFGHDHVLLHPLLQERSDSITLERPMPTLADFTDPILARIWDPRSAPLEADELPVATTGRRLEIAGESYVFMYRAVAKYGEAPWLVGSYFREAELGAAELRRIERLIVGGGAILVISVLLSLAVGRLVGRPILRFARASREIERGNFAQPPLTGSPIREFDQAARAFNDMVDGLRDRERIRDLFGKYVPPEVVETVLADPDALELAGQKREITVLFSDIEGFTALSEGLQPDLVLTLLNAYFEGVCSILVEHGGIIVDFVGDAVFAIFGAPIVQPDHAHRALAAARSLEHFTATFAAEQRRHGLAFGRTRVGIHTGIAIVGNIGSHDRLKYGAAGDVVNTASRLEGANKIFGSRILASAAAVRHADDPDVRPMGSVAVQGRAAPVEVFEVLDRGDSANAWHAQYLAAFAMLANRPADAAEAVRRLFAARPDDRPVGRLLDRLEGGATGELVELAEK
ncbi:MAG: HAMP domain-containing protein [Proteobacteria bacterium]|nr:HAMP domain-containing protein [Pseudomonadota bacterium]